MSSLSQKKCIPCSGGVPPLAIEERKKLKKEIHNDWDFKNEHNRLCRKLKFKDYKAPWELVNKISQLAENEWHHPEISFGWGHLEIEIWTHKIDSLVESDFIFAAKVDALILDFK